MEGENDILLEHWSVDYGDGSQPEEVSVPHAWRQDVPPSYEGPVTYRTSVAVDKNNCTIVFSGVSYEARVSVNGNYLGTHRGIWDAFEFPLNGYAGDRVEIEVEVIKNGGAKYPVQEVASGFLPYVFHTFGGIFGTVRLVDGAVPLIHPPLAKHRASVRGSEILVDGEPFYVRGLLHWGWYPEIGHPRPSADVIRREVKAAQSLGFNLIKFCLWAPPHQYLEIMREEGLEAWMELPIWAPSPDPQKQAQIAEEVEAIVRQYRHHDNILIWTAGCELSSATSREFRQGLNRMIKNLTGSPLVKDNSGSSEVYGGDQVEFGDFFDFHPYCDTQFYPSVLDSLNPGPRVWQPTLLGEFNDADVHRDLPRLAIEMPYWSSTLSELNDQGVRLQFDLPAVLASNRFALNSDKANHAGLVDSSRSQAAFMRKTVHEAVRARDSISGYVVTGMRDTPISTAGFFDDWDEPRFTTAECATWNSPDCLFLIPARRPPWVSGGNRPGYLDPFNQFAGQVSFRVGVQSDCIVESGLLWRIKSPDGTLLAKGSGEFLEVEALEATQIGFIDWPCPNPGEYLLEVEFGNGFNSWPFWVTNPYGSEDASTWKTVDDMDLLGFEGGNGSLLLATRDHNRLSAGLMVLTAEGTLAKPFWREAAHEFLNEAFWQAVPFARRWERLLAISPDRVIDQTWLDSLPGRYEVLMNRIDVRTYKEDPLLVRVGDTFITTLRPFGGLGNQPMGIPANGAGLDFIRAIAAVLKGHKPVHKHFGTT